MKKLLFILMAAALAFTGCNKDNPSPTPTGDATGVVNFTFTADPEVFNHGKLVLKMDGVIVKEFKSSGDSYSKEALSLKNDITFTSEFTYDKSWVNEEKVDLSVKLISKFQIKQADGTISYNETLQNKMDAKGAKIGTSQGFLEAAKVNLEDTWVLTSTGLKE